MSTTENATSEGEILVNGEARPLEEGMTLTGLLESLELDPATVVVERNREIVPRERYPDTPLSEGDRIELVHFVGGG
jgi:thiamine biosynthesis protein ThiS